MFVLVDEIVNGFALVKVMKKLVENVTLIGSDCIKFYDLYRKNKFLV